MERQAEAEKKLQEEQKALQAVSDVKESIAQADLMRNPRNSSDTSSIASKPSDEMSLRSSGIMNQLKARFRPQSNQTGSSPNVPQPMPASNQVSIWRNMHTVVSPLTQASELR